MRHHKKNLVPTGLPKQRRAGMKRVMLAAALAAVACATESGEQVGQKDQAAGVLPVGPGKAAPKKVGKAPAPDAAHTADGRRRVWVMMKQKPGLAVAKGTSWKARGAAVHKNLQDTAKSSQASLLGFLAAKKIEHRSFWAVNTVQVTAPADIIDQIALRPDVERIVDGFRASIPEPISKTGGATPLEVEWGIAQIRAPEAWADFGVRGEDVVVATIDTGAEFSHPALLGSYRGQDADGNIDHNYNWHDPSQVCGSPSTVPCDNAGHGTHTMGTIAGDDGGDNQIGVAPGVKWITAKGCEDFGCSDTALLSSAQWMLAPTDVNGQNPDPSKRPHIVSNSWGGGPGDPWYQEMVQAWVAAGIFPVFANGNAGDSCGSASSPGDYPESYGVGAYDMFGNIAGFSGRGGSAFGGIKPNISGPGVDVRSSVPGGGYDWYSGTSMATPHVAGAVALLWSAAPALAGDIEGTRAILDGSAIDHEDLQCGGTAENNNVWGEGSLDVYAALEAAPIGPSGTMVGVVSSETGDLLLGARVTAVGPTVRNATTDAAGAYSVRLPVGTYEVTASAFGYVSQTTDGVGILEDTETPLSFVLAAAPSHQLDGYVFQADGTPIFGAEVVLVGTPLPVAITDDTGHFSFGSVPDGTYSLSTNGGGCFQTASSEITLSADTTLDTTLPSIVDAFGYQCRPVSGGSYVAETPVGLTGDDSSMSVPLPFPFTYYGQTYESVQVTTNGFIHFADFGYPSFVNEPIPSAFEPNAGIYALWDDLTAYDPAQITMATIGSAPERIFVIAYNNVQFYSDYSQTASFQIALHETGEVVIHYDSSDTPLSLGQSATAGIENETGAVGIQYSHNKAALRNGLSVLYEVPFAGFVAGVVTDEVDGAPLAGVTVSAESAEGVVRSTNTISGGFYRLQLTAGPYAMQASKTNFESATADVTVVEDSTVVQDFALASARAAVSPPTIQLLVPQGQARTRTFELSNAGSLDLTYEIKESGGAKASGVVTAGRKKVAGGDPNARTAQGVMQKGTLSSSPSAVGDVLFSFNPGLGLGWGIGQGDGLWIGDYYTLTNYQFTLLGVPTGVAHPTSFGEWAADMAFDVTHGAMCQLAVGGDNGIHCWDQGTGDEVGAITGGDWTFTSQRGLAYKPANDSFFVGGWNDGTIYNVQGLGGASPGEVISSCYSPDYAIAGLAYNEAMDVLWVSTNSYEDYIYELNPYDCTVLAVLPPPQAGGFQGAGLDLDGVGNLWAIAQSPNTANLIESGVPIFSDVPWLSVAPTAGSVGAGDAESLVATVNTAGMTPGLYLATVHVQSNAANAPTIQIPVSLVVSGFVQAIDTGSTAAYVDSTGEAWVKDQAYKAGSWGYVQKGSVVTTNKAISGTPDPILFQSQRSDPYAYRFDGVPNGVYELNVHFAELDKKAGFGKRLFDVIIENQVVLPAHDIFYEVGLNAADSYTFFVPVTDGRLDFRLITLTKKHPPVINALRVAHRPDR